MMAVLFKLVWPRIIDIRTAELASRQGIYRAILGIAEFIIVMIGTDLQSIGGMLANFYIIWIVVGTLIYFKLRFGVFFLVALELVISYLKLSYLSSSSYSIAVIILLSLTICIMLSLNSIRGIIKFNKCETEQEHTLSETDTRKMTNLTARIIELGFVLLFGIIAYILSKP